MHWPLTAVIQEAYIQGISTRSVDDLVKALGMSGVSKSQVSRLCGELDERVGAFLNRQIAPGGLAVPVDRRPYRQDPRPGASSAWPLIVAVEVNTKASARCWA